jgi:hypothetical protein
MHFGLMQYSRLVGTNFSKNSCIRSFATENETWSLELVLALDIVLALCSLSALFFALCFLWRLLINAEKKEFNF